jgi:uncharacterized protein
MLDSRLNRLSLVSTPVLINALEFAEQSLEIHDKIRASNLSGLRDVLFSGDSEIKYRLAGRHAARDKPSLRLEIRGTLELICQRCLGRFAYPLSVNRYFELVADESALPESDLADDEVDYLVIDPAMDVVGLVEEEVLLALPMALRHEDYCTGSANVSHGRKPSPFQVLEGLKVSTKNLEN